MINKQAGVYQISFASSDKKYIGSAVNLALRKRVHLSYLRRNVHQNKHLQNAFNKYGEAEYKLSVVLVCDPENCVMYEQMVMDAFSPERLYNIRPKAKSNLGVRFSEESKERVRQSSTGRKHTPEARAKMSAIPRGGYKLSPETCAKMSAKVISQETRDKLSIATKKQWESGNPPHNGARLYLKPRTNGLGIGKYIKSPEHREKLSISAKAYWDKKRALAQVQREV